MRRYSNRRQSKQLHYSPNLLSTINNGIENGRVLHLEYDSNEKGVSSRDVEPMAVIYRSRKRNLVAWCRLRSDYRCFRLDRINLVNLLREEFSAREDFNVDDFIVDEQDMEHNDHHDEYNEGNASPIQSIADRVDDSDNTEKEEETENPASEETETKEEI